MKLGTTLVGAASGLIAGMLIVGAAQAQAFDPGPRGSVPGSSVSGMRINGAPTPNAGRRIRGADVFGDTVEERTYGRNYDDSYLKPRVPRPNGDETEASIEERAVEGRPDLNGISAGAYATQGPNAIGRSEITRGSSVGSHRAIIRRSAKPSR